MQYSEDTIKEIKNHLQDYLAETGRSTRKPFLCINPEHDDHNPSMSFDSKHNIVKCFSCGKSYDVLDLIGIDKGIKGFSAECEEACKMFKIAPIEGTSAGSKSSTSVFNAPIDGNTNHSDSEGTREETGKDYSSYFKACNKALIENGCQYLKERGLSDFSCEAFNIGLDNSFHTVSAEGKQVTWQALIIPTGEGKYSFKARNIDAEASHKDRYRMTTGGSSELFNMKAIKHADKPIFVVEGELDAMAIFESGGTAVALGSTANASKFMKEVKAVKPKQPIVLALDNDYEGANAQSSMNEELEQLHIRHLIFGNLYGKYKDADELRQNEPKKLEDNIQIVIEMLKAPDNTADYISNKLAGEIKTFKESGHISTGFKQLDKKTGGIYPGLYVIGGISSVGKTTYVAQICDQMAAGGENVLYFSMEQSRLEMVSKSIARQSYKKDRMNAVTSLELRNGSPAAKSIEEYRKSVSTRISVIEGNFDCTVGKIRDYTEEYMQSNNCRPVVCIDYLQLLRGEPDSTGRIPSDTKTVTDNNVTELKRMSRSLNIPVLVISSLNRSNYLTPVDFESFKESGGIEYSCDVLIGVQLDAINEPLFSKSDAKITEKRERIKEAKQENPRKIEVSCLKNRYGVSNWNVKYSYNAAYDTFTEMEERDESGYIHL